MSALLPFVDLDPALCWGYIIANYLISQFMAGTAGGRATSNLLLTTFITLLTFLANKFHVLI